MLYYLVIGICIFLLIAVIYISAKPISMGIEARRNIPKDISKDSYEDENEISDNNNFIQKNLSDEITRLNNLKNQGVITEDEYKKAKEKLLS